MSSKDVRKIVYKKVKEFQPHCDTCGERLKGNGSFMSPYECKCGVWGFEHKWDNFKEFNYFIIKPKENTK